MMKNAIRVDGRAQLRQAVALPDLDSRLPPEEIKTCFQVGVSAADCDAQACDSEGGGRWTQSCYGCAVANSRGRCAEGRTPPH